MTNEDIESTIARLTFAVLVIHAVLTVIAVSLSAVAFTLPSGAVITVATSNPWMMGIGIVGIVAGFVVYLRARSKARPAVSCANALLLSSLAMTINGYVGVALFVGGLTMLTFAISRSREESRG